MKREELLRRLPAVSVLLSSEAVTRAGAGQPPIELTAACRQAIDEARALILRGTAGAESIDAATLSDRAAALIAERSRPHLRRMINATGVILHTNLGRSLLADSAVRSVGEAAAHYSNLELDISTGERGSRYSHVADLLTRLTGAEAALVVNNNAAAVLLALTALARGREVIVSRGQLVEIGGAFRIPEVMEQGGAHLVEVGSTNKTHVSDYERAITDQTALLLRVHTSNYRIIGFTDSVPLAEMARLGRERGIPVMDDVGSGVLIDLSRFGLPAEPTVQASVAAGADIVTFSGDKLLGGPQAGIIVGRQDLIDRIRRHPLNRALRIDKLTLAALEATLRLYLDEQAALREIPTLAMLTADPVALRAQAENLVRELTTAVGAAAAVETIVGFSAVGGGALPEVQLPTTLVAVRPHERTVAALEEALRQRPLPVLARIQDNALLLDVRTLRAGERAELTLALAEALA